MAGPGPSLCRDPPGQGWDPIPHFGLCAPFQGARSAQGAPLVGEDRIREKKPCIKYLLYNTPFQNRVAYSSSGVSPVGALTAASAISLRGLSHSAADGIGIVYCALPLGQGRTWVFFGYLTKSI